MFELGSPCLSLPGAETISLNHCAQLLKTHSGAQNQTLVLFTDWAVSPGLNFTVLKVHDSNCMVLSPARSCGITRVGTCVRRTDHITRQGTSQPLRRDPVWLCIMNLLGTLALSEDRTVMAQWPPVLLYFPKVLVPHWGSHVQHEPCWGEVRDKPHPTQ